MYIVNTYIKRNYVASYIKLLHRFNDIYTVDSANDIQGIHQAFNHTDHLYDHIENA